MPGLTFQEYRTPPPHLSTRRFRFRSGIRGSDASYRRHWKPSARQLPDKAFFSAGDFAPGDMNGSWLFLGIPLVAAILLVLCVQKGGAIKCWECNSHYDPDCRDPFNNHSVALADCDARTYSLFPDKKASVCRKIIQKINDEYRYVRGCGWFPEDKVGMECIKRAGTFHVLVQYCSCDTDKCNSAPANLRLSVWLMIPAVAVVALLTLHYQHHQ